MVVVNLVECRDCEFVFRADSSAGPKPKGRETCPNCGGQDFQFIG